MSILELSLGKLGSKVVNLLLRLTLSKLLAGFLQDQLQVHRVPHLVYSWNTNRSSRQSRSETEL